MNSLLLKFYKYKSEIILGYVFYNPFYSKGWKSQGMGTVQVVWDLILLQELTKGQMLTHTHISKEVAIRSFFESWVYTLNPQLKKKKIMVPAFAQSIGLLVQS